MYNVKSFDPAIYALQPACTKYISQHYILVAVRLRYIAEQRFIDPATRPII